MESADTKTSTASGGAFRIGDLRIDPQTGEVSGPGGRVLLDPKVMGVLVLLAERAGQVVSREDFHARLWPDVVVTDDALSRCLYDLRRQLAAAGGSDAHRALVETLPKRGYRLLGECTPAAVAAPQPAARKSRTIARVAGTVAAAALILVAVFLIRPFTKDAGNAPRYSIAVLPFADLSETRDQQYLADGIAEEILDRLSRFTDLRVIARTSSFWFRGRDADVADIARKLDVTHVLEGSVRRSGNELRVTAQLIATRDSSHVWSTTFERQAGDLFAVQDDIASGVAAALGTALDQRELATAVPLNREAHEHFLRGEYLYHRRAAGDIERSVAEYEAAVAIDPAYARAWASLAGAYAYLAWISDPPVQPLIEKQRQAAERAVELDPHLAIARIRLAQYFWESDQEDKAKPHIAIAKRLDPAHPMILSWASTEAFERGDMDGAIESLRRAVEREPISLVYRGNLAVLLLAAGQLEQALAEYRWIVDLAPGSQFGAQSDIVRILVMQGRFEEAKTALEGLPEGRHRDHAQALLYHAPGERAQADAAFARLRANPYDGAVETEVHDAINLAEAQAVRGDLDGALATLQAKLERFTSAGVLHPDALWYLRHEAKVSPFLKPLHADPRWAAFLDGPP